MNNKLKPDISLRKKYHTDYYDKSEFATRARLLQSIWRSEQGYSFEKYGNFLELEFAKESGANFLTKGIYDLVKFEVDNKRTEGKVIKEPRIWNNLLSSQPLAFNVFGELSRDLNLATLVFRSLFPQRKIGCVTEIKFEYSPGRRNPKYTSDSSAFDVFIEYENKLSEYCFFGIEVKYAENLNDEPATHKEVYSYIAEESNIFDMSNLPKLKNKPIQQVWRDHLLALSLFITNNDYQLGDFIYLYPKGNLECQSAIEKYKATFNEKVPNYFKQLTLEDLLEAINNYCSDPWVSEFENRYLNFEKIP